MKVYVATVCGTDEEAGIWQEVVGIRTSEDEANKIMHDRVNKVIEENYELEEVAYDYRHKGYAHYASQENGGEIEGQVELMEIEE